MRVAKRENNNKRAYLVVNRLQAKHIPAEPHETMQMFDELADILAGEYPDEKLLIVGFAETATAIGARLAIDQNSYYIQTTREKIEGVEYLYFTESHSHATEQKLIKTDLDRIIDHIDRIVFAEDEVTTGNTIRKIINLIKKTYPHKIGFSVASILNGMDEYAERVYRADDIRIHYLVKTDHRSYTDIAESFRGDGIYVADLQKMDMPQIQQLRAAHYIDGRRLVRGEDYKNACNALWQQISDNITVTEDEHILVMGTEEFMYPAIHIAYKLSESGCSVVCHSTTRSPIAVSSEPDYPFHCRYELRSFYDQNRKTYVYDIDRYDKVLVITDAANMAEAGIHDLCCGIALRENKEIHVIRWCDE